MPYRRLHNRRCREAGGFFIGVKKILFVNLTEKEAGVKTLTELDKYIGGVGIGLKLLLDHIAKDPVIFSIGPLNGFFPFASKTSIVFSRDGAIEDLYIGGTLSSRIKFAGIDALVLLGKSKEPVILDIQDEEIKFRSGDEDIGSLGLPGKRSVLRKTKNKFFLDDYFMAPESFLERKLNDKNIKGIVITGTKTFEINDREKYEELYNKLLERSNELTVAKGTNPSCFACPQGCGKSQIGEIGGDVLVHSLVACNYSRNIYSNIGVVFSCLNSLEYDYTHEDIEALPILIKDLLKELT
jgi:hypothetical protein